MALALRYRGDVHRHRAARIDRGLSVLGTTEELGRVLADVEPDEVLIAVPSAPGTMRARVVAACRERGVPVRTMPTVFELLQNGSQLVRQVREVRVEDVLGREPVLMETEATGGYLTGRCVLVTGAGGSIGAELSRQISRVGPSRLVLIDHAEDNLFEIERELVEDRHALNTLAVLADCRNVVLEEMRYMSRVRRCCDRGDAFCLRDLCGSGQDRRAAETVANQDRWRSMCLT